MENDVSKYTQFTKVAITRILKKDKADVSFFDVVTIAMSIVERIKNEDSSIVTGQDKKNLAKSIIPIVLNVLVELGKISIERAKSLSQEYLDKADFLEEFIDTAALLTNNPDLINAGKWISQEIASGCKCTLI